MAAAQPCAKYQYIVTLAGPKILPVAEAHFKDAESPADYNEGGYLQVKLRDTFKDGRYTVLRKLGWGHFSTVWLVKDNRENRHSALKVVKSARRYAETARDEIKLLRQVMDANPSHVGRNYIVSFLDSFTHTPSPSLPPSQQYGSVGQNTAIGNPNVHICIVFEPLGENLLALVERHKATGVPAPLAKIIAKQILLGLQYLHEECKLVHTDIKPENILISIPDVEAYIQAELSRSPPPASRKVGVPPQRPKRAGFSLGKQSMPLAVNTSVRQVQIFDSQPLISPSSSGSWSSRSLFMEMTKIKKSGSHSTLASPSVNNSACPSVLGSKVPSTSSSFISSPLTGFTGIAPKALPLPMSAHGKQASAECDLSQSELSSGCSSMAISSSAATASTPPSSVDSSNLIGALEKVILTEAGRPEAKEVGGEQDRRIVSGEGISSVAKTRLERELEDARCMCMFDVGPEAEEDASFGRDCADVSDDVQKQSHMRRVLSSTGPSLLSQTAPPNMHKHRAHCSTYPQCSKPSKSESQSHSPSFSTSSSLLPSAPPTSRAFAPSSVQSDGVPELSRSSSTSGESSPTPLAVELPAPITIKIADLGNATPLDRHYTEDIQTRQYRAPEAITGRNDWGATADIWSLACVVFELLTAEYLFDPQTQGELFSKDDDHCAQIIELLGPWPKEVLWGGKYSRDIFDMNGNLLYIRNLKPWPLQRVMVEKYGWDPKDSQALCDFLLPMLSVDHFKRAKASDLINHPWLNIDLNAEMERLDSW